MRTGGIGSGGEHRSNGLWGSPRGGRGTKRGAFVTRGLLGLLALALAAPLAASAGSGNQQPADTYVAPTLQTLAAEHPDAEVHVLVGSDRSAGRAADALDEAGYADSRELPIVDAAAAEVRAGDLDRIADTSGLAIVPDTTMVLDGLGKQFPKPGPHEQPSSNDLWTSAVGVDRLWPQLVQLARRGNWDKRSPSIAFVDSGIDVFRDDFAGRIRAQVTLTSLPGNSSGDGRGHGTFMRGWRRATHLGTPAPRPRPGSSRST